jgi:hypothetical protein
VTKLREDFRADITRLEGKVQALEPRRAGQAPSRTKREAPAPDEGGAAGSAPPRAADHSPSGSDAPNSRAPAAAKPQTSDSSGAQVTRTPSQVLRRPSPRDRGPTETPEGPKRPLVPGSTAGLPAAEGPTRPSLTSRKEAGTGTAARTRTTIRRSADARRAATKDRGVVRSAGSVRRGPRRAVDAAPPLG